MAAFDFPLGWKFRPTPHELLHFLDERLHDRCPPCPIFEVDLLSHPAERLPRFSALPHDSEWFFFHQLQHQSATRVSRKVKDGSGFWKTSGSPLDIKVQGHTVGTRKLQVHYKGKPRHGVKTGWIIHEFSLHGADQAYVVCRLFNKKKAASEEEDPATVALPVAAASAPTVPTPHQDAEEEDPAAVALPVAAASAPTVPTLHQDAVPETVGASMEQVPSSESVVIQGHTPGVETLEVLGPEDVLSPGTACCPTDAEDQQSGHVSREQGADLSDVAAADAAAAWNFLFEGGSTGIGPALLPWGTSLGVSETGVGAGGEFETAWEAAEIMHQQVPGGSIVQQLF